MAINYNSHFFDSDSLAALQARYPDAKTHVNDRKWILLFAMHHYNWPLPVTFPTDAQFSLAELFMPNRYDDLFMPNRHNVRPIDATDELTNHITELVDWVDDITHQWGWYEDSPKTDAELASAENQAAWDDFTKEHYAAAQVINDEIFGPGMSPKHLEFDDYFLEESWPLLDVISRLRINNRPYYFRPADVLAPQMRGTLHVAGLTLRYEVAYGFAGLPRVTLDFFAPFGEY
jgi:hypothetical protein